MTSSRRYHSPLRTERAVQTRTLILLAARRLFETNGFAGTTIKDIASEAGVAAPTVYATFGSKAGIVTSLLDQLEADAGDGQPESTPPQDPDAAFGDWLDRHTRLFERGRPLLRVVMQALSEPGVAKLVATGDGHRRRALEGVFARLAEAGRLRTTTDLSDAVDQAWALSSVGVFLDLTDRCGWTTSRYRRWLEDGLRRLLLDT